MFSCVFITQQVLNLNGDSDFYNSPPLRYPAESCRTLRAQDPSKHSSLSMLKTCDASTSRITSRPRQHFSDTCDIGKFMVLHTRCCLMLLDNHGCREKDRKFTVTHSKCFHFFAWQQCTTSCEITSPDSNPEPACAVCFVRTCFKRWERSLGRLGSECTLESIPENSACWQRHCTCHISLPFSSISAERSWKLLLGQMKANPVETNESNQLRLLRSLGSTHNRTHKWVTGNDGGFLARWLQGSIMQQGIMKNHWKSWFFMNHDNIWQWSFNEMQVLRLLGIAVTFVGTKWLGHRSWSEGHKKCLRGCCGFGANYASRQPLERRPRHVLDSERTVSEVLVTNDDGSHARAKKLCEFARFARCDARG